MTMRSNKAIVNAAGQTITTAGLAAGGALNPEQAKKFIQQTFEATPLSGLVRHELRSAKTGEIDKIGVGRRLLRKKTENTDDGYRSGVKHGKLEYACTPSVCRGKSLRRPCAKTSRAPTTRPSSPT